MFADINLFKIDQQKFFEEIREVNMEPITQEEKEEKAKVIKDAFRDKIRKYLPTCLNIINSNFGCKFSLYKVGRDVNSSFKVIETNVKKGSDEVRMEINNLLSMPVYNSLSESVKQQISLASEILIMYAGDVTQRQIQRAAELQNAVVSESSIITNTPRMSQEGLIREQNVQEIQYNPYADIPVSEMKNDSSSIMANTLDEHEATDQTNFSMDIFN